MIAGSDWVPAPERCATDQDVVIVIEDSVRSPYMESAMLLLRDMGVSVSLVTVRPVGPIHAAVRQHGFPAASLNARDAMAYPFAAWRLRRMLRTFHMRGVVHAHEPIAAVTAAAACVGRREPRVLMHRHHVAAAGAQAMLSRLAGQLADAVVAVSAAAALAAAHVDRVPTSKIFLAHNGVDEPRVVSAAELSELRRAIGIGCRARVVTCVARLRQEKGVDVLLQAFGDVLRGAPDDVHLVIVGDGPELARLRKETDTLGLAGVVHFVGHQADVTPWLALASVVAVPSRHEAFGLAAVEAMACGRPVVASRTGGLTEIVAHRESGLLVEPENVGALGKALASILNDAATGVRLGEAGRRAYTAAFTRRAMVEAWVRAYRQVGSKL